MKIDLNKIPDDWLELTEDGKVVIANENFAAQVREALEEGGDVAARNGGCDCPTSGTS